MMSKSTLLVTCLLGLFFVSICPDASAQFGPFWALSGNNNTGCNVTPCANFVGTTDLNSFEIHVNGDRVYRIEPGIIDSRFFTILGSPNIIGGSRSNAVTPGITGATIAGGGQLLNGTNRVTGDYGTVGGGESNTASNDSTVGGGESNTASGTSGSTVSGGESNTASSDYSTVSGGDFNTASSNYSTVSGGSGNTASGFASIVAGGFGNTASGEKATIAGGGRANDKDITSGNRVTDGFGTVGGGGNNQAGNGDGDTTNAPYATVAGGGNNTASGTAATVAGGRGNTASGVKATIAGGGMTDESNSATGNRVTDDFGTVGGGGNNQAGNGDGDTTNTTYATVAGGGNNTASGAAATVSGGISNTARSDYSTVSGGASNTANRLASVSGGFSNTGSGSWSAVGGGISNTASGNGSTVSGGLYNTASSPSATVGGGDGNTASRPFAIVGGGFFNTASGRDSTVPGGQGNTASGDLSFAAGCGANTNTQTGAFVWADGLCAPLNATAANQFLARATGGVEFITGFQVCSVGPCTQVSGVQVAAGGGSWSSLSDRNVKDHLAPVDKLQFLARVLALPITTWNYKTQVASIRHIGPMAQDFFAAFNVGEDDRHITDIDEGGVALAAIQGLNQKLERELDQKEARLTAAENEIRKLKMAVQDLVRAKASHR